MCLDLRREHNKPYPSKSKYRWKYVSVWYGGTLASPVMGSRYRKGEWMKAKGKCHGISSYGFHVFMTRRDAKIYAGYNKVVRVKVKGFLHSGTTTHRKLLTETYKYMKIAKNARVS